MTQGPVGPVLVAVDDVFGQDLFEVPAAEDQHPVEALTMNRVGAENPIRPGQALSLIHI